MLKLPIKCICLLSVPVLVVDPRAVEQGGEEVLFRTHTLQHQADAVQGRQQEEDECNQEAAVIGLSHTAVYPTGAPTQGNAQTHKYTHTGRQNIVLRPKGYTSLQTCRTTHISEGVADSETLVAVDNDCVMLTQHNTQIWSLKTQQV